MKISIKLSSSNQFQITSEKISAGEEDENLGTQLAMVGATIPRSLDGLMKDIVPVCYCFAEPIYKMKYQMPKIDLAVY